MSITKLYTFPEFQKIIGGDPPPSLSTLKRWAREGHLPVVRLSSRVIRIDEQALQHFIASSGSHQREEEE
jgi:hypothetical protein